MLKRFRPAVPAPDYMANAAPQDVFFGFDTSAIRPGDRKALALGLARSH